MASPATQGGFLIQGNFGKPGNFEVVVPLAGGGLAHFWRANSDPGLPWHGPGPFGGGEDYEAAALIQGNFGKPGNFEVVARTSDGRLAHFWRANSDPGLPWHGPSFFANGVVGIPSLIQGNFGKPGNFEVVVPLAGGGLAHFWRANSDPGLPWHGPGPFGGGEDYEAAALIQGNFGKPGNFEVVARTSDGRLAHFWRANSDPGLPWHGPSFFPAGPPVRIRADVWKLAEWDPVLLWYARAVAEMQNRPLNDPTSWRYQAAIHAYNRASDPLASPADSLPPVAERNQFWSRCQHNQWYFLPWHRMYLLYFEQIVASVVAELGGPSDWALPYWNYSDSTNPNARRLPPAFRQPTLPDGQPNPLFVASPNRRQISNDGTVDMTTPLQVDLSCLREAVYEAQPTGGSPGFGGGRSGFAHSGNAPGALENVPHGSMHGAVGGWMGFFNTAGLDPIFWLHHCNVDRLWSVWLARNPNHRNPTDAQWLTSLSFSFHDAGRNTVTRTPADVVDTQTAQPHGYQYDDISDPIP